MFCLLLFWVLSCGVMFRVGIWMIFCLDFINKKGVGGCLEGCLVNKEWCFILVRYVRVVGSRGMINRLLGRDLRILGFVFCNIF